MIGVQLEVIHWGFGGDASVTVDGKNPASGLISPVQGRATTPLTQGIGRVSAVSSVGSVRRLKGTGRTKRSGGSGGVCG